MTSFCSLLLVVALAALVFAGDFQRFPTSGCLESEGWLEFDGHCYKLVGTFGIGEAGPLNDVRGSCVSEGPLAFGRFGPATIAHLADVVSQEENDFIADVVAEGQRAWLGAYYDGTRGAFIWQLENIFVTRHFVSGTGYTNWKPNEPNNANGEEGCVEINRGPPGQWNDIPCRRMRLGVCKYNIDKLEVQV